MTQDAINLKNVGDAIEQRFLDALQARPAEQFAELSELRDLAGNNTGYIRVYEAERLVKASFLSIGVGPGRYFNVHIIPDAALDIPRFLYEGMLMPMGSQVSMDLFPDVDAAAEVFRLLDHFSDAAKVYDEARKDPDFHFVPSRQLHMRAFSSPLFLLTFDVEESQLAALEHYAHGYFDAWLTLHREGAELSAEAAVERIARREHMSRTLIELDPDRHLVVQVYGEQTTQAIEAASML